MYALIMAGGVGSRLWPKSRQATPKQFLNLTGQETMIQTTLRRILPLMPPENVFVVTGKRYVALTREQLPELPAENIIGEISGKNTAPAIALGALHIAQSDPAATIAVLTADHLIPAEDTFRAALLAAENVAKQGKLVTLGITPTGPETGYGYIHRGEALNQNAYRVRQFLEKPDRQTAQHFFESSEYYWNSGMFIWQLPVLFDELQRAMPGLFAKMQALKTALFSADDDAVAQIWTQVESQSIDVGLMEKSDNVAVVPLDAGWNDVGSWAALYNELAQSSGQNVSINAQHLDVDSSGLLIQGAGKLIATIGLQDLAIIQTEDALLICPRDKAQDVKKIVNQLKQSEQTYL